MLSYDVFISAFLRKIHERKFKLMDEKDRNEVVIGYMKSSIAAFNKICKYDLISSRNDDTMSFDLDIPENEVDEIVDIVSEGMVLHWMKPFVNRQELLENVLNTRDFVTYSPAELLLRVGNEYKSVKKSFKNMIVDYSYDHGDLESLHL